MSSKKFDQLAAERPEVADLCSKVRAFLTQKRNVGDDAVFSGEIIAELLNAPQELIGPVLDEMGAELGLVAWDALECSNCETVIETHSEYCSQCLEPNRGNCPVVRYVFSTEGMHSTKLNAPTETLVSPTVNEIITWVHLSDIHFGHPDSGHSSDRKLVLKKLIEDLSTIRGDCAIPSPGYVLVTGDIAFSGNKLEKNEYALAREFLSELSKLLTIEHRNIYLIPGNHDVQRCADKDNDVRRLIQALRSGSEDLDKAIGQGTDKRHILDRHSHYLDFAKEYAPYCRNSSWLQEPQFWHDTLSINDVTVRLVGLNTASLSFDDMDKGKLRIGKTALSETLAGSTANSSEITIVLSHHPLSGGWLADETECMRWIRSLAQIHLSGHIHDGQSFLVRTGSGKECININAGAVHGDKVAEGVPAKHGYNIASLSRVRDSEFELRIWFRTWSDKQKSFVTDSEECDAKIGFAVHPMV